MAALPWPLSAALAWLGSTWAGSCLGRWAPGQPALLYSGRHLAKALPLPAGAGGKVVFDSEVVVQPGLQVQCCLVNVDGKGGSRGWWGASACEEGSGTPGWCLPLLPLNSGPIVILDNLEPSSTPEGLGW